MGPPMLKLRAVIVMLASATSFAGCPEPSSGPSPDADAGPPDVVVDSAADADGSSEDSQDAAETDAGAVDVADAADIGAELDAAPELSPDVPPDAAPEVIADLPGDTPTDVSLGEAPSPGDLMITELMVNPVDISDLSAEWIELTNLSGTTLDLTGCVISDDGGEVAHLSDGVGSLSFGAAQYVVARLSDADDNGGVTPDLALPYFTLSNAADEVIVTCDGVELDAVRYSAEGDNPFPLVASRAMSFGSGGLQTPDANDDGSLWCSSQQPYSDSNFGSPGAPNGPCADPPEGLEGCRLTSPDGEVFLEGGDVLLAVEVYDGGVTDTTPFVDPFSGLSVEVGWGPYGTDPTVDDTGWSWLAAPAAVGWSNPATDGYDRYEAVLSPPSVGTFSAAARAAVNGGDWLFCDVDDVSNGFGALGSFTSVDNPCAPNPCDTPPAATCVEQLVVGYQPVGECSVADGFVADCSYAVTYQDCSSILGTCVGDQCVGAPPSPSPGDLVISEVLIQPQADGDPAGEWFEVVNVSGADLNLAGCVLRDLEGEAHVIAGPLLHVEDAATIVFARSTLDLGSGVAPHYVYGDAVTLDNDSDEIQIVCEGLTVDAVAWDAAFLNAGDALVGGLGASIALSPDAVDSVSNDDGSHWCGSVESYGNGDKGTPGVTNPVCAQVVDVVKCRLQSPAVASVDATLPITIIGRLRQPGLTDITSGNDPSPAIVAQAAWGPDGTDPSVDASGWAQVDATPTVGWSDVSEPGVDQYEVVFPAPAVEGSYDVAFRFSVDGGASWAFCDLDTGLAGEDGSENGYQVSASGDLTVEPLDPCDPNPCSTPDEDACNGDVLTYFGGVGTCVASGQDASCDYPSTDVDCAALGGSCEDAACVGLAGQPEPGEVIFSEIMLGDGDKEGQWVEVLNISGGAVNLAGCDFGTELGSLTLSGDPVMFADERLVFAYASVPGGAEADIQWAGGELGPLTLGTSLALTCGVAVDVVDLASGGFEPPAIGRSYVLDEDLATAAGNDSAGSWCAGGDDLGVGLHGSPGDPNTPCPAATAVTRCRLESPDTFIGFVDDDVAMAGRVSLAGVTDLTHGIDPSDDLLAEGGFGPQGDPLASGSWALAVATPNAAWDGTGTGDEAFDEYLVTVAPDAGGTFDAAFRFSGDRGRSWTSCDLDTGVPGEDGSEDGYASANAGTIALFDPCDPNPCTSAPTASCNGDLLTSYPDPGLCAHLGGVPVCDYPPEVTDCSLVGGVCNVDQCDGPPAIAPGEVLISELMALAGPDGSEWVEFFNTTGEVRNFAGCALDIDGAVFTISTNALIDGGSYVVMSAQPTADFASAVVYGPEIPLSDTGSAVILTCGASPQIVDAVTVESGGSWPIPVQGRSLQLDASSLDVTSNDSGAHWCTAADPYGASGEFGTPAEPNGACP